MNDTILVNSRQKAILDAFKDSGALSRRQVQDRIAQGRGASKITLIRDLNALMRVGLLTSKGKGRSIRYFPPISSPLLTYIDMEEYFRKDPYKREGKRSFDMQIFNTLNHLFTEKEKMLWNEASEEFIRRIANLDKTIYKRELERFIVEFSWKSAQIEGNTYDLLETETLFTQNIKAKGRSHEEAIMLVNHKEAFDTILANKKSFLHLNFSDVVQLHGILTKHLATSGIRRQAVRIAGTSYIPPSLDLTDYLRKTIALINAATFPPEKALIASVIIAYIQPFNDGNKRTGRMLSNAILLAHDFPPLSYRTVDVNEYKKSLIVFYEQNNVYPFKKIFTEQLQFAVENYFN